MRKDSGLLMAGLICAVAFVGGTVHAQPSVIPPPLLDEDFEGNTVGASPTGWAQVDASGNLVSRQWTVSSVTVGEERRLAVASTTKLKQSSFLFRSYPAQSEGHVLEVRVRSPRAGRRGVTFGLSFGSPHAASRQGMQITFHPAGRLMQFDGIFIGWIDLAPFEPEKWYDFRLIVDPSLAAFELYVNGQKASSSLFPFWNTLAELDTVFFSNGVGGGEGEPIFVESVRIYPSPSPPTPKGLTAKPTSPSKVTLCWDGGGEKITEKRRKGEKEKRRNRETEKRRNREEGTEGSEGRVAAYRIYRAGQLLTTVAANVTQWQDVGLKAGVGYAYAVSAVDARGNESLQTWPVLAITSSPIPRRRPPTIKPATGVSKKRLAVEEHKYDVVVLGGVPGGIAAAITAARMGAKVALVSETERLGGMMSGGLGRTDFRYKQSAGGVFKEFVGRVYQFYKTAYGEGSRQVKECNDGYFFEPRVAAFVFDRMVAEERNIVVYDKHRLSRVKVTKSEIQNPKSEIRNPKSEASPNRQLPITNYQLPTTKLSAVTVSDVRTGRSIALKGKVFIDATYEGDLAAMCGVQYRVGREAKWEYDEEHAGVLYFDYIKQQILPESTGEGDRRVQAYNYRLCITRRPENRAPIKRTATYNRKDYVRLLDDFRSGHVVSFTQIFSILRLPNEKFDVNNHPYPSLSTDLPEENFDYPEARPKRRAQIARRHRDYILGLLWFLQNDEDVPPLIREEARQWGLAMDEFVENDHFPTQLYVREARRIVGLYTFNENDARAPRGAGNKGRRTKGLVFSTQQERAPIHEDSVAVGDYPMDSHATRKKEPGKQWFEGFFYLTRLTKPYQIPYQIMIPKDVDGLLVVGAVSATHIGFGTIRMEPVWMALGQAAGTAAWLAIQKKVNPTALDINALQEALVMNRHIPQIITYFHDVDYTAKWFPSVQFFGAKGFFPTYRADADQLLDRATAARWLYLFMKWERPDLEVREVQPSQAPHFSDVPNTHPDFQFIEALAQLGVIPTPKSEIRNPKSEIQNPKSKIQNPTHPVTQFRPDAPLLRWELALWLVASKRITCGWELFAPKRPFYHDVPPDHPACAAIETLRRRGIGPFDFTMEVVFPSGFRFEPTAPVTRGDFCFVLFRAR